MNYLNLIELQEVLPRRKL